jgi:hypothetical protein
MTERESRIEEGQEFTVDVFKPEDAPGITRLFREVYGEAYPARLVYNHAETTDSSCRRFWEHRTGKEFDSIRTGQP